MPMGFELQDIKLHGHRVCFRKMGEGPPLVLIHGITSSSENWCGVAPRLAEHHMLLAPDLLGHGNSAKPRGDYSMGGFASGLRDLMMALDIPRATIVGHSLGGGVAMQFAYQFPGMADRLALVASGGLGRDVHSFLRAATIPGAELVIPLLASRRVLNAGRAVGRTLDRVGIKLGNDVLEMARGHASLGDPKTRAAFVHTLRAIIDPSGQRVRATDRLYLAAQLPVLLLWGARDRIIPLEHGIRAHELIPGSRLEVFERSGHFPHLDEPDRFVNTIRDWLATTEPGDTNADQFRDAIRHAASDEALRA
jgi:pimeloyl-ACP methyl ester carboxylesterase